MLISIISLSNTQVGIINFSKSFTDYENPVRVNVLSSEIVSITAPHDIVLADRMVEIKVVRLLTKIQTLFPYILEIPVASNYYRPQNLVIPPLIKSTSALYASLCDNFSVIAVFPYRNPRIYAK